jgi:hypothetical protein
VGGNSEMEGRGAGLWVGKSSDLCCEACRELRVWFRFGFSRFELRISGPRLLGSVRAAWICGRS